MACIVARKQTRELVDKINDRVNTNDPIRNLFSELSNFLNLSTRNDLKSTLGSISDSDVLVDKFVKVATNGVYKTAESFASKADANAKGFMWESVQSFIKDMYRQSFDPSAMIVKNRNAKYLLSMIKNAKVLLAADTTTEKMYSIYRDVFKHLGVDPEKGTIFDAFGSRIQKIEHYGPARAAYALLSGTKDYANAEWRNLLHGARSIIENAARDPLFKDKESGIGIAQPAIGRLLVFFDEDRQYRIKQSYGTDDTMTAFKTYANRLLKLNLSDEAAVRVFEKMQFIQKQFNKLNYGKEDISSDELKNIKNTAPDGTVLGFMRNLRERTSELNELLNDKSLVPFLDKNNMRTINKVISAIDTFVPRKNYIPYSDESDPIVRMILANTKNDINLAKWFKHRGDLDIDGLAKADFLDALTTNFSSTALMYNNLLHLMYSTYTYAAVARDERWFRGDPNRRYVKVAVMQSADIAQQIFNKKNSTVEMRKMLASLSSINALILSFPSSALTNIMAGNLNLCMRLAGAARNYNYDDAIKMSSGIEKTIADRVTSYSEKFLISPGIVSEFIDVESKQSGGEYTSTTGMILDKTSSAVMKFTDVATEGFGMGKISSFYHKFLTTKGTEEVLRHNATKLLFNRVMSDIAPYGKVGLSSSEIDSLVKKHSEQVYYDINNALGNYDAMNKPYAYHALFETGDTPFKVFTGFMLKLSYMFRHAGFVTTENFIHSFMDTAHKLISNAGNPYATKQGIKKYMALSGTAVLSLLIGLITMGLEWGQNQDDKVSFTLTKALNPLDEVDFLPKSSILFARSLFGKVSKEEWDIVKEEGIRFFDGFLHDPKLLTIDADKDEYYISRLSHMLDIDGIIHSYQSIISSSGDDYATYKDMVDSEKDIRKHMGKWASYDPFRAAEYLGAVASILSSDADKTVKNATFSKVSSDILKSLIGVSVWSTGEMETSYAYDEYARNYHGNLANRRTFYKEMSRFGEDKTAESIQRYIRRYGRMPKQVYAYGTRYENN